MSGKFDAFLVIYNAVMTVASVLSTASVVYTLLNRGLGSLWAGAGHVQVVTHCMALLETVNALLGISRSGALTSFAQWFGKSNVLLCILYFIPELQNNPATALLFFVWSSSEIVRYYYYLLGIVMGKMVPDQLTWLRYNLFVPMYPLGMLCELRLMQLALPYLKERGLHTFKLPEPLNVDFEYSTFISYLVLVYPLVWLPMYIHMFQQRAKKMKALRQKKKSQ
ncbi:protein-tyrosine phosphatase-like protein [Chloropicon primus]|uniref:Very-long-chain (3R)-3-hydroxyacyl-CoA dehydratase n=2 Tax=Chloropicon primus TaxID=1764295 RepID=A0A5B8MLL3_9CHLO|nr:protein-tyrosine phosphatase-like protein [Chloropicon primus]UPR00533.1 protein-tyrosine phosphatase-like protein [Chloropicon primus]|mmetsp:Transcript_12406/g.26407  ORF Transcript_12406/g.26407 Transcript_12406/m.26407 type:complete len:223 (+) Transcript_12406:396-1064(+)|eukprot:QDZ21317.1 protein-tyrosine phosphatase-like protein [Chloropicon primus]